MGRLRLRTSSYVIYVRLPDENSFMLVHGYTGAVDVVSSRVAESLRSGRHIQLPDNALVKLKKRGYITDLSPAIEREHVRRFVGVLKNRAARFIGFAILVAYDCNLRCPYCFERSISVNGWGGETFDAKTVSLAFEAMELMRVGMREGNTLTLYGGEPLMNQHAGIIGLIVREGKSRGYCLSAITNGYDLDVFSDMLGPDGIGRVQVTVDGGPEEHDRRRVLHTGEGTYRKIMSNIALALRLGASVDLRANVDESNIDGPESLAADLKRFGLHNHPNLRCHISLTQEIGAHISGGDLSPECRPESAASVASRSGGQGLLRRLDKRREKESLLSAFIFPGDGLKDQIKEVIATRKGFGFRGTFCGAGSGSFILDPRGDIYTCWETVGLCSERVGRFMPRLSVDSEALSSWRNNTAGHMQKCFGCKYALLCGGGCRMTAGRASSASGIPPCDGFPARFQIAARAAHAGKSGGL